MHELSAEAAELYETPAWAVHRIAEAIPLGPGRYLDPCVGNGAIPRAIMERVPFSEAVLMDWTCIDIRYTSASHGRADYLGLDVTGQRFDCAVFNPAFSKALEFAAQARRHCDQVFMLQRLSWMQGGDRAEWLKGNPFDLYVLPERPSFTGDGKTDAAGYGWYRWPSVGHGVRILDSTPAAVRRMGKAA